jgi:hypothetical protein
MPLPFYIKLNLIYKMGNIPSTPPAPPPPPKLTSQSQTICSFYNMPDGNISGYIQKTENDGFQVCDQDNYWLGNTSPTTVDYLVIGTWQPNLQVPEDDFICPSNPKDVISQYPRQYTCQQPNTIPCIENPQTATEFPVDYNNLPCNFASPQNNNSGISCSTIDGSPCLCSDNKTTGASSCYQIQNACVPEPPPASIEKVQAYKSQGQTDLYIKNLKITAECCVGDVSGGDPISGYTCGIGLCQGGRNCSTTMLEYCSDPDSIINDRICRKYVNSPSGKGSSDKVTKRNLLSKYLIKNLSPTIDPETNPKNLEILKTCTNTAITDGDNSVCTSLLKDYCKNIKRPYKDIELGLNKQPADELTQLCGCFLPSYPFDGIVSSECQSVCLLSPLKQNSCENSECLLDLTITNLIIENGELIIDNVCPSGGNSKNVSLQTTSKNICNFTAEGVNKISTTNNNIDFTKKCSECRLINVDGKTTTPIKCPKFGDTPVTNCKINSDCKMPNYVCQDGVCVLPDQPSGGFNYNYLFIGLGILFGLILIFVIGYFVYKKLYQKK